MKKEFVISGFRCDKEFLMEFEELKRKLSSQSPIKKLLHNSEVIEYVLRDYMRNYDNRYSAERKLELIMEIASKKQHNKGDCNNEK
ncbi:hypothetical protein [Niallia sp. FSL W8-1348]|uniref:hypothetical protein n=1 Tax=Niallia sp. FSL W8-1348 TaxID=2954656 RepID=UPI0030FD050B